MDVPLLAGLRPDGSAEPEVGARAARAWLAGGIVGLPTETVYGLAADAQDPEAVARVYRAKGRPAGHPLIVHVHSGHALAGWSAGPNLAAERLAEEFWPGALTLVVARSARAGDFITGGQGTVALRSPSHPVAQACLEALVRISGDPARGVAAPSANRFGRVSPTRAADVLAEVGTRLDPARDVVVDGGPCAIGVESTIVDCTATPPRVLRLGAISQAQIDAALMGDGVGGARSGRPALVAGTAGPGADVADGSGADGAGVGGAGGDGAGAGVVRAPGTLESHYAPRAHVHLVEPSASTPAELAAVITPPTGAVAAAVRDAAARAAGAAARDPFSFESLEGSQPARITGGAPERPGTPERAGGPERPGTPAVAGGVGLVGPSHVATPPGWTRLAAPTTAAEYARDLYAALRRADELQLANVVAILPDPAGGALALAVRDRLARAAHQERA
ncbi:MAG TPA: L-threonylcarbamoyladenylate synthase [Motilibacterales bacterium]|nr:L-threonylcarbamoyladenylate synthase [Motilibacterales bacterium]